MGQALCKVLHTNNRILQTMRRILQATNYEDKKLHLGKAQMISQGHRAFQLQIWT